MSPVLPADLFDAVAARFRIDDPSADLATLEQVTAGLHQVVGYDTSRKNVWAAGGAVGDPPSLDPVEFWEEVLADGTGHTCYATVLALDAWLADCGFVTGVAGWTVHGHRRISHATNVVDVDGTRWIIESSSSSSRPVAMPAPGRVAGDADVSAAHVAGTVQLHLTRVADPAAKVYDLVDEHLDVAAVAGLYRQAVLDDPDGQWRFVWARTARDGTVHAVRDGRYTVRAGHRLLERRPIDAVEVEGLLARFGVSDAWAGRAGRLCG